MAAPNNAPVYSKSGSVSTNDSTGMAQLLLVAANDYTGVGANNQLVWTANATNGGFIQRIRLKAGGSNIASVARIFLNNGATVGTATNNTFYGEISLPATTATATNATIDIDYPMNMALDPGFRIYVGLGTAVAAGWSVIGIGGRY